MAINLSLEPSLSVCRLCDPEPVPEPTKRDSGEPGTTGGDVSGNKSPEYQHVNSRNCQPAILACRGSCGLKMAESAT